MTDAAAVKAFVSKWEQNTQKESAAAKEHFAELCRLIGVPTPNDPGSGPDTYCFEKFTNADLANASTRELLRQVFTNPELLRPVERQETITEQAAARLARIAQFLEKRGYAPSEIAHFFMKVLFALFAEDISLLPAELMSQSIKPAIFKPSEFVGRVRSLFRAMKTGDYFGMEKVPQFNGWLFEDDTVLPLNADELHYLADAARLDWSQVEPAIFGTLFERSLDPSKLAQLGAHYTSKDDIRLIFVAVCAG